jgi:hypothetical protein
MMYIENLDYGLLRYETGASEGEIEGCVDFGDKELCVKEEERM